MQWYYILQFAALFQGAEPNKDPLWQRDWLRVLDWNFMYI